MEEEFFLKEALKLAKKGLSWTNPNPMVGAVIVKNGKIIAKGYHKRVGLPHAEIEALRVAKSDVKGSTLYTNLEPCSHWGRTPPCVQSLIRAGISQIVCSTLDPNPKVRGRGVNILKKAGVKVSVGLLEKEARFLNEAFFTFHQKKRPFIAIKFAASLDGKIATKTGQSKWITNESARNYARKLRAYYQAVLVGIKTVLKDNPHLGLSSPTKFKEPLRIILDPELKIPLKSQVLRDNNVLLITTSFAEKEKLKELKKRNIAIISYQNKRISLNRLLDDLRKREIISILVEGGGETIGNFVDKKLVDKIYAFYSPIIIGGKEAISAVSGKGIENLKSAIHFTNLSFKHFSDNFLLIGYPKPEQIEISKKL
ncbi:MAG: bifunctional diaminohydroxyphosphoribosylaminopyrimidine deaminase/5-amino-6-(5-phosphoribosylamino)uracil reductase RibD [Patescibacteria group bacterium]|nr:bifunctional diaminohydroxyphosphoribosylaminopyrimidine deaminase/5-amino-6-(5-phosphoribosylamino)uracil reductase RibD [Patescibacteria group bacterium]